MNTVHLSELWNLYDCQAQLSIITHVCHQERVFKKVPFVCLFQDESNCCWTCDALIVNMICSTHSDKYILGNDRHIAVADHFVFLWVLVWCLAIVKHVSWSLFAWVVTDFWGTKKRQAMCNVVHSVGPHVEKHPCTMLWHSLDLQ